MKNSLGGLAACLPCFDVFVETTLMRQPLDFEV